MAKLSKVMRKYATGGNFDWADAAAGVAPYISNIYNFSKRLPKPPGPVYEGTISPELVSFDADRVSLDRELQGLNKGLELSNSNPGVANAMRVASLGKFLDAKGRLSQTEGNLNADIRNRNKMFNSSILSRNNEKLNSFNTNKFSRKVNQQRLDSENLANMGDKFQMQVRDNNQMELEAEKFEVLKRKYQDTGVVDRNLLDLIMQNQESLRTKKYGGKLNKYLLGGKIKA